MTYKIYRWGVIAALLSAVIASAGAGILRADEPASTQALSTQESVRILHLENKLLAPCCYSQPVSAHMSDVAFQMRKEIVGMVLSGQSDRQILDHYIALYGEQILVDPEGKTHTVLYGLPLVEALVGILLVIMFLRTSLSTKKDVTAPDRVDREQIEMYRRRVQTTLLDYDRIEIE